MKKWTVVALVCASQIVVHIIRVALGVVAPTLMTLYGISPKAMGYVLSGWNWVYTACMLIVGPVVDRFGPWVVMGIGSGIWSLATVALPLAASTAVSLFLMRALFGFGHSMLIPAQASAVGRWFGSDQRATATGLIFSGGPIGLAVGAPVAAFILDRFGWKSVFYCIGGASLLFSLLWLTLYPEKKVGLEAAAQHGQRETDVAHRIGLSKLLRHRSAWGLAFGQMGYLYAYFFFISWLPGYLILERKMSVLRTGIVASLPFWLGMIGTIGGGWLGDYLIRRGFTMTASRKWIIGIGMSMATLAVIAAAFTPQTWLAVTLLSLCLWSMRMTTGAANALPVDLAPPTAVASLSSIQNFGGNIGGLLAPIVTGYLVQARGSFVVALVVAGAMVLFGGISYCFIVGRVETIQVPPVDAGSLESPSTAPGRVDPTRAASGSERR